MERELSNSSFFIICTSKVGTSKCHVCFAAEKAVKSRRSSINFNCKVSSVDGLSLNIFVG
jgi:tRNA threonylcarbamoyladenosine modification (KEOPS) complex Cgi121 subunit